MRCYLTEFIGTFFLVLTIGLAGGTLAPIAIGGILLAMIFMGGHCSGAHFNPAVSLAAYMRGALKQSELVPFCISQVAGAAIAALLVRFVILGESQSTGPMPASVIFKALVLEFLFTFALALTVLNVATTRVNEKNSFYGLAIAFVVVAGAVSAARYSGAAFNPAVGIGAFLMGVHISYTWIHIVAPLAGGAVAAIVFKFQNPETSEG